MQGIARIPVPLRGSPAHHHIRAGSAIVCAAADGSNGMLTVSFEGNVYDASNLDSFHSKLVVAAGRLRSPETSRAVGLLPSLQFSAVADFDPHRLAVTKVHDPASLAEWASVPIVDIVGVRLAEGRHPAQDLPPKEQLHYVGQMHPDLLAFRSRAGQILLADASGFEVVGKDDPRDVMVFGRIGLA